MMGRLFHVFPVALILSFVLILVFEPGIAQTTQQNKRIALLIANRTYDDNIGPIASTTGEIEALKAALLKVGFTNGNIQIVRDADRKTLRRAIRAHARRLKEAGNGAVGLFYYKGHAISAIETKANYLLPVDVIELDDADELEDTTVPLSYLIDKLEKFAGDASNYVLINFGRTTPKKLDPVSTLPALVQPKVSDGMLIAYASSGPKGDLASSFAREITRKDVLAEDVFKSLTANARAAGGGASWVALSDLPELYFAGRTAKAANKTQGKRLALLIGNNAYEVAVGRLQNPQNDTKLLETALNKLGFKVTLVKDAGYSELDKAVKKFARKLGNAGPNAVGLFYYSGHGAANPLDKQNYLIPVDVKNTKDTELWDNSVPLNQIIEHLRSRASNAARFIIFDACRNELNLKSKTKAAVAIKGFVPVQQSAGMLIAYATAPGQTASDGIGDRGPYAKALAEEIVKPGLSATDVFINVQLKVKERIGQDPWLSFPALARIYFNGRRSSAEHKALLKESRRLAALSQLQTGNGDAVTGMLLALEGLPDASASDRSRKRWPYFAPNHRVLDEAVRGNREIAALWGNAKFNSLGDRVLTTLGRHIWLWDAQTGKEITHVQGNGEAEFNLIGNRVLTTLSRDVWLWDAQTGKKIEIAQGNHEKKMTSAMFSPSGKQVLTVSPDSQVRLFDSSTGKELMFLKKLDEKVYEGKISQSGKHILTLSDKIARLWDAQTGKMLFATKEHKNRLRYAKMNPSSTRLISVDSKIMRVWDTQTRKELAIFPAPVRRVPSQPSSISRDFSRILYTAKDKTLRLWNEATGTSVEIVEEQKWARSQAGQPFVPLPVIEMSSDGARILVTPYKGNPLLLDGSTGRHIVTLQQKDELVRRAEFNSNGTRIVSVSDSNIARLWDSVTGRQIATLKNYNKRVIAAKFKLNGTRIVTRYEDNTVVLWNSESGKKITSFWNSESGKRITNFTSQSSRVNSISINATQTRIAIAYSRSIGVWDADTGEELSVITPNVDDDHSLSFTFNAVGDRIITHKFGGAQLWDVRPNTNLTTIRNVLSADYSSDGGYILTASEDKIARLWDATTGKQLRVFKGHIKALKSAVFSPKCRHVLTASEDKTARLWDATTGNQLRVFKGHTEALKSAVFSPKCHHVLTTYEDNTAQLWDAATGKQLGDFKGHASEITSAKFSPDGRHILTTSNSDKTAQIWDAMIGKQIYVLKDVSIAVFSPDSHYILAATSHDFTARLLVTATGKQLHVLKGHKRIIDVVAFNNDGTRLVTATSIFPEEAEEDDEWATARLWDTKTGRQIAVLGGQEENIITGAAFSPDGMLVATSYAKTKFADLSSTARIWDGNTGRHIATLEGHKLGLYSVIFAPDGQQIMTSSEDGTARIWHKFQHVATLMGLGDNLNFAPDGGQVMTRFDDGTVRIWRNFRTIQELVDHAKNLAPHCLTREQREKYFLDLPPPEWCIRMEKSPYDTKEWKEWLSTRNAGKKLPMPGETE